MSNYVDTVQLQNGTDYPIRVPNGVCYRNPSGMTPSQNPLLRRNDLVQTLSNDEDNPPSSKAVKTVTDGLSSDLASYERIGFGTCDYINGTSILAVMDNIEASGTTPISGTLLALNATDAPTSSDNYMIVFYGYRGTARKILEAFQYNTGKKYHCVLSPVNSHYINLTGWLED